MGYLGYKPADKPLTAADITDSIITSAKITDATIVNGDIANSTIALAKLSATGTPSASTFLRGDNSWVAAGGANTPAFSAYSASGQSFNQDTHTVAQFDTELFDTNSCYDTSTYKFTPNVSGKYVIGSDFMIDKDAAELKVALLRIRKNGSTIKEVRIDIRNSTGKQFGPNVITLASANGSTDYFDVTIYSDSTESNAFMVGASTGSIFYGYKIIE
jgi:hypothetical protein